METEKQVLFAGFGGQGVLAMGLFLSHAAMSAGKNVSWVPSYGAEMRGGTANCLVTISENAISSPLTENPLMAVIMNRPSLDKFEDKVKTDGILLVNSSMVDREPKRKDIEVLNISVNKLAEDIGNPRGANMIMLGAYIAKTGMVQVEEALEYFNVIFKGKDEALIEKNREAFITGVNYARNNWQE